MERRNLFYPNNCLGCRYWSAVMTQCVGGGAVQAMCLACEDERLRGEELRPYAGRYTRFWQTCPSWASGELGAIDERGSDPGRYKNRLSEEM